MAVTLESRFMCIFFWVHLLVYGVVSTHKVEIWVLGTHWPQVQPVSTHTYTSPSPALCLFKVFDALWIAHCLFTNLDWGLCFGQTVHTFQGQDKSKSHASIGSGMPLGSSVCCAVDVFGSKRVKRWMAWVFRYITQVVFFMSLKHHTNMTWCCGLLSANFFKCRLFFSEMLCLLHIDSEEKGTLPPSEYLPVEWSPCSTVN